MRNRVPGRFIASVAILSAFLCLLPASSKIAVAKPISWEDVGPIDPNATGDNDGVVLKSKSAISPTLAAEGSGTVVAQTSLRHQLSGLSLFLRAVKLDYWSFWLR
jgi:hypothetical protein